MVCMCGQSLTCLCFNSPYPHTLYLSPMHGMHFHFIQYMCTQIHGHPLTPLAHPISTQSDITLTKGTGIEKGLEERGWREGGIGGERGGNWRIERGEGRRGWKQKDVRKRG